MLDILKKFHINDSIYFECLYRNINGFPTDPANPAWTIKNKQGSTVNSGVPYKKADGIWYFFWTPSQVGQYTLIFSGSIEGNSVIIRKVFKVVEIRLK